MLERRIGAQHRGHAMKCTSDGKFFLQRWELASLQLTHLLSGVDSGEELLADCGRATTLSGYTEWVSPKSAALSLGWDWQMAPTMGEPRVKRLGLPRTNIQVVDDSLHPLPWEKNLQVLADFIDDFEWTPPALEAVCYIT